MAEEPSLSYYLPTAGGRIIGFIPFPRILVLCEMQSVSSRIWTRIAMFISYSDNDYTTGTLGEGKLWIQTICISLKTWPYVASCPWLEGLGKCILWKNQSLSQILWLFIVHKNV